jgi:hypothetical protein
MTEATAPLPIPAPTLEQLVAEHNENLQALSAEMAGLRRELAASRRSPGRMTDVMLLMAEHRLTDIEWVELGIDRSIREAATLRTLQQLREPADPPPPRRPGRRAGRHALRSVPALAVGAVVAVAGRASARKAASVAVAVAAVGGTVTASLHVRDLPDTGVVRPPAAISYAAAPVPPPAPAVVPSRPRRKHARPRVVVAPVPQPTPTPSVTPSPSPSPTTPPPPLLLLSTADLGLGVYMRGQVTIGNPDQDVPVSWSVTCGQDVLPSPSMGVLEPGQQGVPVRLVLDPVDGASEAVCTFQPGGETLQVRWSGPPSGPAGSPSP